MKKSAVGCFVLLGCGAGASAGTTQQPPSRVPSETGLVPTDGGAEQARCQLETSTTFERRGAVYEVTAWLRNRTNQTLEVDMPDRCPQGAALFQGLPEGYDYYRSCTKGACIDNRPPIHHSIPAGQTIDVEAIEIDPVNPNCNHPLEPGTYRLGFTFETPLALCQGSVATIEHFAR
jgi:hypothetical protein